MEIITKNDCPIWCKYNLTPEEAAVYFNIGVNKIRAICNENKLAQFVLWSGNRMLIKRVAFEDYLSQKSAV